VLGVRVVHRGNPGKQADGGRAPIRLPAIGRPQTTLPASHGARNGPAKNCMPELQKSAVGWPVFRRTGTLSVGFTSKNGNFRGLFRGSRSKT